MRTKTVGKRRLAFDRQDLAAVFDRSYAVYGFPDDSLDQWQCSCTFFLQFLCRLSLCICNVDSSIISTKNIAPCMCFMHKNM